MVGHHRRLEAAGPRQRGVGAASGIDHQRRALAAIGELDLVPAQPFGAGVAGERRGLWRQRLPKPQLHHLPVALVLLQPQQALVVVVVEEPVLEPEPPLLVAAAAAVDDVAMPLQPAQRQGVRGRGAPALVEVVALAHRLAVGVGAAAQEVELELGDLLPRGGRGDQRTVGAVEAVAAPGGDQVADRRGRVGAEALQRVVVEQRPVAIQQRGQLGGAGLGTRGRPGCRVAPAAGRPRCDERWRRAPRAPAPRSSSAGAAVPAGPARSPSPPPGPAPAPPRRRAGSRGSPAPPARPRRRRRGRCARWR